MFTDCVVFYLTVMVTWHLLANAISRFYFYNHLETISIFYGTKWVTASFNLIFSFRYKHYSYSFQITLPSLNNWKVIVWTKGHHRSAHTATCSWSAVNNVKYTGNVCSFVFNKLWYFKNNIEIHILESNKYNNLVH